MIDLFFWTMNWWLIEEMDNRDWANSKPPKRVIGPCWVIQQQQRHGSERILREWPWEREGEGGNDDGVLETRDGEARGSGGGRRRRRCRVLARSPFFFFFNFWIWLRQHRETTAATACVQVPYCHPVPGGDPRHHHHCRRDRQWQDHSNPSGEVQIDIRIVEIEMDLHNITHCAVSDRSGLGCRWPTHCLYST